MYATRTLIMMRISSPSDDVTACTDEGPHRGAHAAVRGGQEGLLRLACRRRAARRTADGGRRVLHSDVWSKHRSRQQIKRDVEAQQPALPGPKQPASGFTDPSGAEASKDQMRALVESLARANLGEMLGIEKVEAARRPHGKVDVTSLNAAVDAANAARPGAAPAGVTAEGAGAKTDTNPSKPPAKDKPVGIVQDCLGPRCDRSSSGAARIGPIEIGPQPFPGHDGNSGTVVPGMKIPLPWLDYPKVSR